MYRPIRQIYCRDSDKVSFLFRSICNRYPETSIIDFFRKLKNAKLENENFYFANDNKDSVKVVGTAGLGRLWQQHLIKLPLITLETAEAIMSVYPMPQHLFDAYKSCSDPENLLKDVPIRRGAGPLSSSRRIGPEMSRKIFEYYHTIDPHHVLN